MFLETSLAEAEGARRAPTGPKLLDLRLCFPAGHGLGVARGVVGRGVEDQPPEPTGHSPLPTSSTFTGH